MIFIKFNFSSAEEMVAADYLDSLSAFSKKNGTKCPIDIEDREAVTTFVDTHKDVITVAGRNVYHVLTPYGMSDKILNLENPDYLVRFLRLQKEVQKLKTKLDEYGENLSHVIKEVYGVEVSGLTLASIIDLLEKDKKAKKKEQIKKLNKEIEELKAEIN